MTWLDRAVERLGLRRTKTVATMLPAWQNMTPTYTAPGFENTVKDGYRKNELIYACIAKTANTAASVSLRVFTQDGKTEIENHPLRSLLQQPNPYMAEFDLWVAVITLQKLCGVAYFEKVRSGAGLPVQLWPLRPDWVSVLRDSKKFIAGYEYGPPGLDPVRLAKEDVLRFPLYDPLDMYRGTAPVAVAARTGDVDNATNDFLKLFFEHGAVPMGLLTSKQKLTDAMVSDIRRRWRERYGGWTKWTEPAVLDSDATYQQMGLDFEKMGFEVLDARNETRICMVLDVPPIIVGAKVGLDRSTFSNYGEARRAWWQDSLMPQYAHIADIVENDLAAEYGAGLQIMWDFSQVPALQEENNSLWARMTEALRSGGITINEYRAELGMDETPSGDVFLRPTSATEIGLDGEPVREPVVQPDGQPTDEEDSQDDEDAEQDDDEKAHVHAHDGKARGAAPDDDERAKRERKVQRAMEAYFGGQLERITGELGSNGNRNGAG